MDETKVTVNRLWGGNIDVSIDYLIIYKNLICFMILKEFIYKCINV